MAATAPASSTCRKLQLRFEVSNGLGSAAASGNGGNLEEVQVLELELGI